MRAARRMQSQSRNLQRQSGQRRIANMNIAPITSKPVPEAPSKPVSPES